MSIVGKSLFLLLKMNPNILSREFTNRSLVKGFLQVFRMYYLKESVKDQR